MKILLLFNLLIAGICCQNETIFSMLKSISPELHSYLENLSSNSDTKVNNILNGNSNITFLLPNALSLNNSIQTGALNFSNTRSADSAIRHLILNNTLNSTEFLEDRKYYTTLLNQSELSIGPSTTNQSIVKIYSGTKANIIQPNIHCTNGLIHIVDNFLQPAETPLKTISKLSQTNYMEVLLKSLNISEVISAKNRSLLVPIDSAWKAVNGSTLPFGKLLHDLRYMSLKGIYTSDQFINRTLNITTDYGCATVTIDGSLMVNNMSKIVETDILTTSGVIHLIDTVLEPPSSSSKDNQSNQQQQQPIPSNACKKHPSIPFLFLLSVFFNLL